MRILVSAALLLSVACTPVGPSGGDQSTSSSGNPGVTSGNTSGTLSSAGSGGTSGILASSSGGVSGATSGGGSSGGSVDPDCATLQAYFRDTAWPRVFSRCVTCHVSGGAADGTRYILKPTTIPDYLQQNMAVIREASRIIQDGRPLLVLKSTQAVAHGGGVQVVAGSEDQTILETTITEVSDPSICPQDPRPVFEGVTLHDAYGTLRKAAYQLAGRPPNAAEVALVDANGLAALDGIVDAMMTEEAFFERLREMFSDVLLTDGFRANNVNTNTGNIVNREYYPDTVSYGGQEDWDWRAWPNGEGIRLVESLAREPVEFFVQATRNDRSAAEAVTEAPPASK